MTNDNELNRLRYDRFVTCIWFRVAFLNFFYVLSLLLTIWTMSSDLEVLVWSLLLPLTAGAVTVTSIALNELFAQGRPRVEKNAP